MINSRILSIYTMPPEVFSVIIKTDTGFYSIEPNGYYQIAENSISNEYKKKSYQELEGQTIVAVKSDFEYTVIKLSNGGYILYHVDTPFLDIVTKETAEEDIEFFNWIENEMQDLNDGKPFLEL